MQLKSQSLANLHPTDGQKLGIEIEDFSGVRSSVVAEIGEVARSGHQFYHWNR